MSLTSWLRRARPEPSPAAEETAESYVYRPHAAVDFDSAVAALRADGRTVVEQGVDNVSPSVVAEIVRLGEAVRMHFEPYAVDVAAYRAYFDDADYVSKYPDYYRGNQPEKSLEHFLAADLLSVGSSDVFVDVASESSPVPEIYARVFGATTYSQDIQYPEGVGGHRIGGDACAMPVRDGFATKAALTCSLEHFERDADSRLFRELARVLRPGGSVCVVPFYVFTEHVVQTDPSVSVPAHVPFDTGAPVYAAKGWGNRHGRFYSPESFMERIAGPCSDVLDFRYYVLTNAAEVDPSCYARFVFTATRR